MKENNFEYDLSIRNILELIKSSLRFFVFLFIVVMSIGVFYAYTYETKYKAKIEINYINKIDELKFASLNFATNSLANKVGNIIKNKAVPVLDNYNKEYFYQLFIEELRDKEEVYQYFDEDLIQNKVSKKGLSSRFEITESKTLRKINSNDEILYSVNFNTTNPDEVRNFFKHIFESSNFNSIQNIKNELNSILELYLDINQLFLEQINFDKKTEISKYEKKVQNRKQYLLEQLEIAKALQISKPLITSQEIFNFAINEELDEAVKNTMTYYLMGSTAIEKELELLMSRENINDFVISLIALDDKANLKSLTREIEFLRSVIDEAVFNDDNFKLVYYDLDDLKFVKLNYNKNEILLISFFIFLLLSFFSLIFFIGYNKNNS